MEIEYEEEQPEKYKITKDEQYLLASGLYKCCRLGDAENAVKYAEKLKRGTSAYYVFRILSQLCGEDLSVDEYLRLMPTIRILYEASKTRDIRGHDLFMASYCISLATKWFQDEKSIRLEKIKHQVNAKVKEIKITEASFLLDEHTRAGLKLKKEGKADLRLSGTWENRWNIFNRWKRFVEENPNLSDSELKKKWIELHHQPDMEVGTNGKEK